LIFFNLLLFPASLGGWNTSLLSRMAHSTLISEEVGMEKRLRKEKGSIGCTRIYVYKGMTLKQPPKHFVVHGF
jgi:hypothetical protein